MESEGPDGPVSVDKRTVELDLLIEQSREAQAQATEMVATVKSLIDLMRQNMNSNKTTVIHKTEGMSAWSTAAVVACFFTFLGLLLFALVVLPELHDLKAWSDIYRNKITQLEKVK